MASIEDLLRLAADSNVCCAFEDKLAQIVEENAVGYLEDDFWENVAGGAGKKPDFFREYKNGKKE